MKKVWDPPLLDRPGQGGDEAHPLALVWCNKYTIPKEVKKKIITYRTHKNVSDVSNSHPMARI